MRKDKKCWGRLNSVMAHNLPVYGYDICDLSEWEERLVELGATEGDVVTAECGSLHARIAQALEFIEGRRQEPLPQMMLPSVWDEGSLFTAAV